MNAALIAARKTHRCCECRSQIDPGTCYVREAVKSDGTVDTNKFCVRCYALMQSGEADVDGCIFIGDVRNNVRESLRNTNGWKKLLAFMRKRVAGIRAGQLRPPYESVS